MKRLKKLKSLDKYVIFCISVLVIYSIAEFITSTITGIEKSSLTMAVFGFFGAPELTVLALIKIFKLRGNDNDTEDSGDCGSDILHSDDDNSDCDIDIEQEG